MVQLLENWNVLHLGAKVSCPVLKYLMPGDILLLKIRGRHLSSSTNAQETNGVYHLVVSCSCVESAWRCLSIASRGVFFPVEYRTESAFPDQSKREDPIMKSVAVIAITLSALTAFAQDAPQKIETSAEKLRQTIESFKTQKAEDIPLLNEYQHKARLLKTQFDELLVKFKEQQAKIKEASKAYANAIAPKIKTGADREKIGWYYKGNPTAVMPMSEYENRMKGRGYDTAFKYKTYSKEELEAAKKETKEKFDEEKKMLSDLQAQLKQVQELYKTNTQDYKTAVEQMLKDAESQSK